MTAHKILVRTWTDPHLGRRATATCKGCAWTATGAAVDVIADKKQHETFAHATTFVNDQTGRS